MIVKDTFLNKLREAFTLNIYEVKIWTALLSKGISTAGELSDIGEVPRSRCYDVLESLEKKGFVIMKIGKPIKYLAVKPEDVIRRVKKQIKKKTDTKLERLENIKKTNLFEKLKLLHTKGIKHIDPNELTGALKGRENINEQINNMLNKAEKSVILVTTSSGLIRKYDAFKKTLRKLKEKNVNIKIVAPINKENLEVTKELLNLGEIRNTQRIDARFLIIDSKEVMFMLLDDKDIHPSYDVGIWLDSPFFASSLENLFNAIWDKLEDGKKVLTKLIP